MKLIMENWQKFLTETEASPALPLQTDKLNTIFKLTATKFIEKVISGIIPDRELKRYEFFDANITTSTTALGQKSWEYSYDIPVNIIKPKSKGEKASDYLHWFAAFSAGRRPRNEMGKPAQRTSKTAVNPTAWLVSVHSRASDEALYKAFQESLSEKFSSEQLNALNSEMGLDNPQYNSSIISFSPLRKQPKKVEKWSIDPYDGITRPRSYGKEYGDYIDSKEKPFKQYGYVHYDTKTKQPDETSSYYGTVKPGEVSLEIILGRSHFRQKYPELPEIGAHAKALANLDLVKMSHLQSPRRNIKSIARELSGRRITIPRITFRVHTGFTDQPSDAGTRVSRSK
jgi:hypothetical protein